MLYYTVLYMENWCCGTLSLCCAVRHVTMTEAIKKNPAKLATFGIGDQDAHVFESHTEDAWRVMVLPSFWNVQIEASCA